MQLTQVQNLVNQYGYSNCTVDSVCALAANHFALEEEFLIYPNPASTILNIDLKEQNVVNSIAVYNILGQIVISVPNANNVSSIDVSNLQRGNYFIKINSDKGTTNAKFAKN